ncbi:CHAT domain-containing protein [Pantanalinema rosaneae CENA516]|uniref:CHAT domain-containing protein n=1 Tax=Pantanalinema rosaneae TaxID=1620701 RepID=UPI003D6FC700
MSPCLKSISFVVFLVCAATIALGTPSASTNSLVLAQPVVSDRKTEAERLFEQGIKQLEQNQPQAAIASFEQALVIYRELKDRLKEGHTLRSIGNAYWSLKNYPKVIEVQQQVLAIAQSISNTDLEARALNNIGVVYKELNKLEQAIEYYNRSLNISQRSQNFGMILITTGNLGVVYEDKKEYQQAVLTYQQMLDAATQSANRKQQLNAQLNIANVSYSAAKTEVDYQRAIEQAEQGLKFALELKESSLEARALIILGNSYIALKKHQMAINYFQKAIAASQEAEEIWREVLVLKAIGDSFKHLKDYSKAIDYYQQAVLAAKKINDTAQELAGLFSIGNIYSQFLKDDRKAISYYQQALRSVQKTDNGTQEILILQKLVDLHKSLKDFSQVIQYYQQVIIFARDPNKKWGNKRWLEAYALGSIGDVYTDQLKEYQTAILYYQKMLKVAEEISNSSLQAPALLGMANTTRLLAKSPADYQEAMRLTTQGLKIAQDNQQATAEAVAWSIYGNLYKDLKDFDQAIASYQNAITAAQKAKDKIRELSALYALAYLHSYTLSDYPEAIKYCQQALTIAQELKEVESEGVIFALLSEAYFLMGNYSKSIEFAEAAKLIGEKNHNPKLEALGLLALTSAYYGQGDQRTEVTVQQSLQVAQRAKNRDLEAAATAYLSWWYADVGAYDKAYDLAQRSLEIIRQIKNQSLEEIPLYVLGTIYQKRGQSEQAIATFKAITNENSAYFYRANLGLAQVYQALKMPVTAIAYYKQAINKLENIRNNIRHSSPDLQQAFLNAVQAIDRQKTSEIYRQLAGLLIAEGRIGEAQQVLELLKIQEINDFKQPVRSPRKISDLAINQVEEKILTEYGSLVALGQKITNCQQTQCPQLNQLLDQQTTLLNQYNQAIRSIETSIRANRSIDDNYLDPRNEFGRTASVIIKAQPGTVLIYPLVLEDKLWLLLATDGGLLKRYQVNVNQKELGETVLALQTLLRSDRSDVNDLQQVSQKLYSWLIQPLEKELKATSANGERKVKNLVFALDRVTRYIPTSVLFDGKQYLVENYSVSTILGSSQSDWRDQLPLNPEHVSALALGVSEAYSGFSALPNVPVELDTVVQKEKGNPGGIYPGLQFLNHTFSFEALRNNLYGRSIVHIATHGKFVPGRAEDSYLLLGTGEKLAIPQIETLQNLDDVHLVVLSACETALGGPGKDGVEINGISSYFLNRGAKSVIASLWLVNDASTSLLMRQFYTNLAAGNMTKAEALRQAQLNLLQGNLAAKDAPPRSDIAMTVEPGNQTAEARSPNFSHPYYWAPFVLIGNSL